MTRPLHQAAGLVQALHERGLEPTAVPCLEIVPPADVAAFQQALRRLSEADWLVFVSRNAVDQLIAGLAAASLRMPEFVSIAAIGAATRSALYAHGIAVAAQPLSGRDSEALLEHPAWQAIDGKRVVIIRGQQGREALKEGFTGRGAQVEEIEVYQRVCPTAGSADIAAFLSEALESSVLTVTSVAVMDNLYTLTPEKWRKVLLQCPLVVISERIARAARALGFTRVVVAGGVSDVAVANAVMALGE